MAGGAVDFECIELRSGDVPALAALLEGSLAPDDEEPAIFSCGDWSDLGGTR